MQVMAYDDSYFSKYQGGVQAAYDYRAFGEQVDLEQKGDKVTENFTGKERDDETELNYFGARYLDPMLGLWVSVDAARQFASPYLYAGNGVNPVNSVDPDGNASATVAVSGGKSFGPYQTSASIGLTVNFPPKNARDLLYLTLSTRNGAEMSISRPGGKPNGRLRVTVSNDNASEGFSNAAVFSMGGSVGKKIRGNELYVGGSVSEDLSNDRTSYSVDLGVNGEGFDAGAQVESTCNISIIGSVMDVLDSRMQNAINTTYTEDDAD